MKILLFGASGFVGRHFQKVLSGLGIPYDIASSEVCNLMDINSINHYFSRFKKTEKNYTHIIHLAVNTKAGSYSKYHTAEQFHSNQLINTNVLHTWYKHFPEAKMIAFGTSCSYDKELEMKEENYMLGKPELGFETYAMTKRMLLNGLESYNKQYGMNYMYYVPSIIYGPDYDLTDKHFIFDLIRKITNAANYGMEPVTLFGDGSQIRNLIYVRDVISMVLNTLEMNNKVLNLCNPISASISTYAKYICTQNNYPFEKIIWEKSLGFGSQAKELVVNPVFKDFNFTKWQVGIDNTINYYIKVSKRK
jgi:GDP-L-fucose synthase